MEGKTITKICNWLLAAAAMFVMMIILSPCLLIFTEGKDGGITVFNFIGIAYLLGIIWLAWYVNKRHNAHKDGKAE